jgi:hypothetical protein
VRYRIVEGARRRSLHTQDPGVCNRSGLREPPSPPHRTACTARRV